VIGWGRACREEKGKGGGQESTRKRKDRTEQKFNNGNNPAAQTYDKRKTESRKLE